MRSRLLLHQFNQKSHAIAPFHQFGPYWGFKKHKPIKQSHQPFNMHAQNSIETIGSEKKSPWHVWAIHLF